MSNISVPGNIDDWLSVALQLVKAMVARWPRSSYSGGNHAEERDLALQTGEGEVVITVRWTVPVERR